MSVNLRLLLYLACYQKTEKFDIKKQKNEQAYRTDRLQADILQIPCANTDTRIA